MVKLIQNLQNKLFQVSEYHYQKLEFNGTIP